MQCGVKNVDFKNLSAEIQICIHIIYGQRIDEIKSTDKNRACDAEHITKMIFQVNVAMSRSETKRVA